MSQFGSYSLGVLTGIAALYAAMHFTVVQAKDGFHVVPKIAAKLESPYQDIRSFKLSNWQQRQPLALAIVRANKGYLLSDPSLLTFRESLQNVLARYQINSSQPKIASAKVPESMAPTSPSNSSSSANLPNSLPALPFASASPSVTAPGGTANAPLPIGIPTMALNNGALSNGSLSLGR